MGPSVKFVSRINGSFSKKNYESTRNLGARWAPISSWWPSATLLALFPKKIDPYFFLENEPLMHETNFTLGPI